MSTQSHWLTNQSTPTKLVAWLAWLDGDWAEHESSTKFPLKQKLPTPCIIISDVSEGTQMGRARAAVIITAILLVSVGGAAVIIWQANAEGIPLFYVLGALMVAVSIGLSALHLSVSD